MSAAGTAKTRTEAQQIITRLQFAGNTRAQIAKQLGVSAETVKSIAAGKSSGLTYLTQLRQMQRFIPTSPRVPAPSDTPASVPAPAPADTPTVEPEHLAAIPSLDTEEAPKDERTRGQKFRDALRDTLSGKAHDTARATLATANKRASSGGDAGATNDNLVDQLVPIVALVVVILTQLAIPERYSTVGPTHEEASAILRPMVRAMTRQLEVAGQLTETQMDFLAAAAAMGLYADRAWRTYQAIKLEDAKRGKVVDEYPSHNGRAASHASANGHNGASSYAPQAAPDSLGSYGAAGAFQPGGPSAGSPFAGQPAGGSEGQFYIASPAAGAAGGGDVPQGSVGEVGHGPDPFAQLYAEDAAGRRRLGIN